MWVMVLLLITSGYSKIYADNEFSNVDQDLKNDIRIEVRIVEGHTQILKASTNNCHKIDNDCLVRGADKINQPYLAVKVRTRL